LMSAAFATSAQRVLAHVGNGTRGDQIVQVRLGAADALYRHLGRSPIAEVAVGAHSLG
jgi:hypothetical protein